MKRSRLLTYCLRNARSSAALAISVASLGGCASEGGGQDEGAAPVCFPAPATGVTRMPSDWRQHAASGGQGVGAGPNGGKETNGSTTQGPSTGPRTGDSDQGRSLQGGGLQGPLPGEQDQGTSLQGGGSSGPRPEEEPQGTSLQGGPSGPRPEEDPQGTSLQGGGPAGPRPEEEGQGSSLQGGGPSGPRPEEDVQGRSFQGGGPAGPKPEEEHNGGVVQGGAPPGMETQGRVFGFKDLNGAKLETASGAPVSLAGGTLTAEGFASSVSLRGVALAATAVDGGRFTVEVVRVDQNEGVERVEITIDGLAACSAGEHGVFVEGAWDERGAHSNPSGTFTYSCMDGVIAKCVDWGYAPWRVGAARHAACTRLARADYCGDGNPWTLDGTSIGLSDTLGVRAFTPGSALSFEAAWGPGGAVCVNETRYAVTDRAGNAVVPSCLATLPTCASLEEAQRFGGELANASAHARVEACGE
jgi:ADYC domain